MWHKEYHDYKTDEPMQKQTIEPGRGIYGCEMHEINGWGNTLQQPKKQKRGFLASLIVAVFGAGKKEEP